MAHTPRERKRRGTVRVAGGGVVCGVAAGCTGNGRWRYPPIVLSGGGRIKQQEDKHKHWDPTQEHTHTGQPEHTGQKAHAHLCVVALLGGWLLLSLSGGRRESGLPPTFVSVRSVVTDLSTCLAYVSAHLKHTCVNLTITVPFYKTTVLRVFELTGLVTMGRSMAIYWPFNGHFHMQLGACSSR